MCSRYLILCLLAALTRAPASANVRVLPACQPLAGAAIVSTRSSLSRLIANSSWAWPTFAGVQDRSGAEVLHLFDDSLKWPPLLPPQTSTHPVIESGEISLAMHMIDCHCPSRALWLCLPGVSIRSVLPWPSEAEAQPPRLRGSVKDYGQISSRILLQVGRSVSFPGLLPEPAAHLWAKAVGWWASCTG